MSIHVSILLTFHILVLGYKEDKNKQNMFGQRHSESGRIRPKLAADMRLSSAGRKLHGVNGDGLGGGGALHDTHGLSLCHV